MVSLFILLALGAAPAHAKSLKGIATTPDGQKIVYTEIHKIELDENGLNKRIETKYYKPDNQLFAEMISDFSKNRTLPDIHFTDKRFNKVEKMEFDSSRPAVVFKSLQDNQPQGLKNFPVRENMAAGQGFDNFVKLNFDKLMRTSVPLQFGVLSKMDFFSFKSYKKKELSKNVVQFGIDLSSFLLRIFTNELVLEYHAETKQLLSYKGLSNILADDGNTQSVWIKYEPLIEAQK